MKQLDPILEKKLFNEYKVLIKKIQDIILKDKQAKKALKILCLLRIKKKQSLAKLANNYSNKILGLNKKISQNIEECLVSGDWSILNLDTNVIKRLEVFIKDEKIKEKIKLLRERTNEIENIIIIMFQPLTLYVAKKYSSGAYGFDKDDLIQEANNGILKSIEKYNPSFITKEGKPVKFLTYAYISASDKVKEYIMNQSRMVRIPKSKLERIFILIEANRISNSTDPIRLALESNKILKNRFKRKLKKHEVFDEKEIENLSYITRGNSVSFDLSVGRRKESLVDLLPDKKEAGVENIERLNFRVEIKKALKKVLTDSEYKVILYKFFFHGDEVSLEETQKLFEKYENTIYSRERINQLKKSALIKLAKDKELIEMLR